MRENTLVFETLLVSFFHFSKLKFAFKVDFPLKIFSSS